MDWVEIIKALANKNRLEIFQYLRQAKESGDEGGQGVTELARHFGLAPSTASEHLKELRRAGLVVMNKHGTRVTCSINQDMLYRLSQFFSTTGVKMSGEEFGDDSGQRKH